MPLGVVNDDVEELRRAVHGTLDCDVMLLSGGTSKGAGDLSYRVVSEFDDPGIVAHGVALKPGKPICLAVNAGRPIVVLPGFPTSAIFTFHEFVAPVIRTFAGQPTTARATVSARLPIRINSVRGRTEYLLVGLVRAVDGELAAYPMGKGSGSVTAFSNADGFIAIDQHAEILDAGSEVTVQQLGSRLTPADLVVIGSHCLGLDILLGRLAQMGFTSKVMHVGSQAGLAAARRGDCDIAGVHLLDEESGTYNRPFLSESIDLVAGYERTQGIVFRNGDERFTGKPIPEAIAAALCDEECTMVNRNPGSGTRILIDSLLRGEKPGGYSVQTKSHSAVAACIRQRRADWGVAISTVAEMHDLGFLPLTSESYDFIVPHARRNRAAVRAFVELLQNSSVRDELRQIGFHFEGDQQVV